MASVRQHRGRLLIDYRDGGDRQRVYTKFPDTPLHRARLERIAAQVDAALIQGLEARTILEQAGLLAAPTPPGLTESPAASPVPLPLRPQPALDLTRPITPSFKDFAEQWFGEFKVGWRKTYITTVRGILDQHLLPRFGSTEIGAVSRTQVLELRSHLANARGRRPGTKLSPARINTIMLILRQVLQEAADRYEFPMPMVRLKPLKVPKSDVQPFTLEQTQLLINTIRKDYQNYLKVRFFTGLRSGELHGLKWKYIDFERRLILVREALVGGEEEYTKNDFSQRDIPMSQLVYDALKAQHAATGSQEYVFCNRAGEPVDTTNFTKRVWYPLLRHLGLTLRRPYQTRHTAATLWLAAGEAPAWISSVLGHASTEMLFRVYSRFVPNLTRRDGSAMDRLLNTTFKTSGEGKGEAEGRTPPAQPPPG